MAYVPVNIEDAVARECRRRRYSDKTLKTYLGCIRKFLAHVKKGLDRISKRDARDFLGYLAEKDASGNTLNVYHMAIRFLLEDILNKSMKLNIRYSKVPEKLPVVLSKEELNLLFSCIANDKHRLMCQMLYSAGLRVSELVNLRVKDIELDRNFGYVRAGKGNKDRLFILAESLNGRIRGLIKSENLSHESYLFTSNRDGRYSTRSLQQIIDLARKKAKIVKKIGCHTLRHSFATHLIENGYSVSDVQSLLGHKSPETTMVYLHTATKSMLNIKSPLD